MDRKKFIGFRRGSLLYALSSLLLASFMLLFALSSPLIAEAADRLVVKDTDGATKKFVVNDNVKGGIGNTEPNQ